MTKTANAISLRMDMRKLVGRNAARLRKAAGLTQEQLAERCGLSQQGTVICPPEQARTGPPQPDPDHPEEDRACRGPVSKDTLYEIAQGLGVSHVELVRED